MVYRRFCGIFIRRYRDPWAPHCYSYRLACITNDAYDKLWYHPSCLCSSIRFCRTKNCVSSFMCFHCWTLRPLVHANAFGIIARNHSCIHCLRTLRPDTFVWIFYWRFSCYSYRAQIIRVVQPSYGTRSYGLLFWMDLGDYELSDNSFPSTDCIDWKRITIMRVYTFVIWRHKVVSHGLQSLTAIGGKWQ